MTVPIRRAPEWRQLPVSLSELSIDTTLRCGQSFRWRKINDEWTCTLHGRILSLKQDPLHLHYRVTWPSPPPSTNSQDHDDTEDLLRRYFTLSLDLGTLYERWSAADKRAPEFTGVRILSQDAWEALLCFICSSNNNISRISQMVQNLCKHYGPLIGYVGDEALYDFPTPGSLTGRQVESHLRELGFGYRAKYIAETARVIAQEKPPSWLESLRNPEHEGLRDFHEPTESLKSTYKEAHEALLSLAGVGPKVADCVCLMGLGWGESVPVDTHVWQIARRDYKFGKAASKTLNKTMYDAVGDHFRGIWGSYAGWAHSVLFTADLREFSERKTKRDEPQTPETEAKLIDNENVIGTRKRGTIVKTEIATVVKVEDKDDRLTLEVTGKSKRRRTWRSS